MPRCAIILSFTAIPDVPSLPRADPCWFCFPIMVRDGAVHPPGTGGCLKATTSRRDCYSQQYYQAAGYKNANYAFSASLTIATKRCATHSSSGLPGMGEAQIEYIFNTVDQFMKKYRRKYVMKEKNYQIKKMNGRMPCTGELGFMGSNLCTARGPCANVTVYNACLDLTAGIWPVLKKSRMTSRWL